MRRTIALLTAPLLLLGLAACGDDAKVDAGDPGGSSTTSTAPDHPAAPSDVVLEISAGGGYVPFGVDFAAVPIKVQRYGTVLTGGAVPAIYPGPAVIPVLTGKLSAAQLQHVFDAAAKAGLAEDHLDAGQPGITDNATTTITVELDGREHEQSVYALGVGTEPGEEGASGLTAAQVAVRKAIGGFVQEATRVVQEAADHPYVPTSYQVLSSAVDPDADLGGDAVVPNELTWPEPDLVLAEGACLDVDAAHTPALTEALQQARSNTIWRDAAGKGWRLTVRGVLPGDGPCPSPET